MKSCVILGLICMNLSALAQVSTQDSTPISNFPDRLLLTGTPLAQRHSDNYLGLACVSRYDFDPCRSVQFFSILHRSFNWIGVPVVLVSDTEAEEHPSDVGPSEAKRLKLLVKNLQQLVKNAHRPGELHWLLGPLTWVGGGASGVYAWYATGGSALAILPPLLIWYLYGKVSYIRSHPDLAKGSLVGKKVSSELIEQTGFNWIERSNFTRESVFNLYLLYAGSAHLPN